MISAPKQFAKLSASPKAFLANSEPSNGTKIFLYIPHLLGYILKPFISILLCRSNKKEDVCHLQSKTAPFLIDFHFKSALLKHLSLI
jgi:hypothetical protein